MKHEKLMKTDKERIKELEELLVEREKLASVGQMTAGIVHEIQNPLNFITNFSNLSKELIEELSEIIEEAGSSVEAEQAEEMNEVMTDLSENLQRINLHGQRAQRIIKGMLAQLHHDDNPQFSPVQFNANIEDFAKLGYQSVRGKNKSFNTKLNFIFDKRIGEVQVAEEQFNRVILNIVNNACYALRQKSTEEEGFEPELTISTQQNGENFTITIEDNGPGIPDGIREKLFQPFFTTKPKGEGTGLGLSMSRQIIEQVHNGTLELESEKGHFTRFIITIPNKK